MHNKRSPPRKTLPLPHRKAQKHRSTRTNKLRGTVPRPTAARHAQPLSRLRFSQCGPLLTPMRLSLRYAKTQSSPSAQNHRPRCRIPNRKRKPYAPRTNATRIRSFHLRSACSHPTLAPWDALQRGPECTIMQHRISEPPLHACLALAAATTRSNCSLHHRASGNSSTSSRPSNGAFAVVDDTGPRRPAILPLMARHSSACCEHRGELHQILNTYCADLCTPVGVALLKPSHTGRRGQFRWHAGFGGSEELPSVLECVRELLHALQSSLHAS